MTEPTEPEGAASDPSMEDILASIRRILDEEGPKAEGEERGQTRTAAHDGVGDHNPTDVLELQPAMILPEPLESEGGPIPPPPASLVEPMPIQEPSHAMPLAVPLPPGAVFASHSGLVAPAAAAAAATSVSALLKTLASERTTAVYRGGPTIEDLVRDEIRPLLKDWLNEHLPPLVERLVRAEIERVVSRMG